MEVGGVKLEEAAYFAHCERHPFFGNEAGTGCQFIELGGHQLFDIVEGAVQYEMGSMAVLGLGEYGADRTHAAAPEHNSLVLESLLESFKDWLDLLELETTKCD